VLEFWGDDADLRNAITKTSEPVSTLPKERNVADLAPKRGLK
jgi:hypothetical protein